MGRKAFAEGMTVRCGRAGLGLLFGREGIVNVGTADMAKR